MLIVPFAAPDARFEILYSEDAAGWYIEIRTAEDYELQHVTRPRPDRIKATEDATRWCDERRITVVAQRTEYDEHYDD